MEEAEKKVIEELKKNIVEFDNWYEWFMSNVGGYLHSKNFQGVDEWQRAENYADKLKNLFDELKSKI
jgi:hypothetical protein